MLIKRIITALILVPIILGLLIFGSKPMVEILFLLCVLLTVHELGSMLVPFLRAKLPEEDNVSAQQLAREAKIFVWFLALLGIVLFSCYLIVPLTIRIPIMVGVVFLGIICGVFCSRNNQQAVSYFMAVCVATIYGVTPWFSAWELHAMESSGSRGAYLIFLLVVVWCSDTGGYIGGRLFGKRKLMERMSPKKTVAGAVTALIASVAGGQLLNIFFEYKLGSSGLIAMISVGGGVAAQLGDLIESVIKRVVGVKDSGAILPGHGGFLDRIDALLLAAPVICMLFQLASLWR